MGERNTVIGIAILIFVSLTAVFGGLAFGYKLEAEALQKRIDIINAPAPVGKLAVTRLTIENPADKNGVKDEISKVNDEISALTTQIDDKTDGLVAKAKDTEGLVSTHFEAAKTARTETAAVEQKRRAETEKAINELGGAYRDLVDSLKKLEEELKAHEEELRKEQENLLQVMASEHGKTDKIREQIIKVKDAADTLKVKLDRMKERRARLEKLHEDGRVLSSDPGTNMAVVDLGEQHGVRPGMVFDVFEVKRDGKKVRKGKMRLRRVEAQQSFAVLLPAGEAPKVCPQCGWTTKDITHLFCTYCLGGEDEKEQEAQRLTEGSSKERIVAPEFLNPVKKGDYISSPFYLGREKKKAWTFAIAGLTIDRSTQEIATFLKENGCTLLPRITLETDFAIVGTGPTVWQEVERARKMGVSVLREAELFDFFGRAGSSPDDVPVED
jgi:NAD-dependent DNA ligase